MTDFEKKAFAETNFMKKNAKINKTTEKSPVAMVKAINSHAKTFTDKDGNHIYDFFVTNGVDNHNLNSDKGLTHHDVHLMIADEIKAIQGDTRVLLAE